MCECVKQVGRGWWEASIIGGWHNQFCTNKNLCILNYFNKMINFELFIYFIDIIININRKINIIKYYHIN